MLNVNNSLQIMNAGKQGAGDEIVRQMGWDYGQLGSGEAVRYRFTVNEDEVKLKDAMSATLAWNRKIDGRVVELKHEGVSRKVWLDQPRITDMDMRLVKVEANGKRRIVGLSDSERDNVEHLYFANLPVGEYEIQIRRIKDGVRGKWAYGLAWRIGGENWKGDRPRK